MGEPTRTSTTACTACVMSAGLVDGVDRCQHMDPGDDGAVDPLLALPAEELAATAPDAAEDPAALERGRRARAERAALAEQMGGLTLSDDRAVAEPSMLSMVSSRSQGTLFKRKDGTVVRSGSKATSDRIWSARGWTSHDDIRREALAYHESLKATQGIVDPDSGEVILPDPHNKDHTKAYAEQHQVSFFSVRDIDSEPAPGYGAESIGRYVATDRFFVDPARDMPELVTAVTVVKEKAEAEDEDEGSEDEKEPDTSRLMIGPRIPVSSTVFMATEKLHLPTVERIMVATQMLNLPVTTPRLLSLLLRVPEPVVLDSFEILRKYTVLERVMGSVWDFNRTPENAYIDSAEEAAQLESRIRNDAGWMRAVKAAGDKRLAAGTDHTQTRWARRKDRKKKGKRAIDSNKRFEVWFAWLPAWFRDALQTSRDSEQWMRAEHAARKGRRLAGEQLEETMARFAWNQYQMRTKWLNIEMARRIGGAKVATLVEQAPANLRERIIAAGPAGLDDRAMLENTAFLEALLTQLYWYTREKIRTKEMLLLRWNAQYVPVSYWEWLMTPADRPPDDMVTDLYRVPAGIYRKHLEAIRAFAVHGSEPEFRAILAEATTDQVLRRAPEVLDASPRSEYDGVTIISLSRLFEFTLFESSGKADVTLVSQRIHDAMGMVDRTPAAKLRPFEYHPDPERIQPLIDKLDAAHVPNYMRPAHMESAHGAECDRRELGAGTHDSAARVRKPADPPSDSTNRKRAQRDDAGDESPMVE